MAVGEGITIPAVSVTEGTVGRMAAHGPVESAAPALGLLIKKKNVDRHDINNGL